MINDSKSMTMACISREEVLEADDTVASEDSGKEGKSSEVTAVLEEGRKRTEIQAKLDRLLESFEENEFEKWLNKNGSYETFQTGTLEEKITIAEYYQDLQTKFSLDIGIQTRILDFGYGIGLAPGYFVNRRYSSSRDDEWETSFSILLELHFLFFWGNKDDLTFSAGIFTCPFLAYEPLEDSDKWDRMEGCWHIGPSLGIYYKSFFLKPKISLWHASYMGDYDTVPVLLLNAGYSFRF